MSIQAENHFRYKRKWHLMSFKQFSTAQDSPSKNKPDDKSKVAPAGDQPATQTNKPSDEVGPPAPKS